MLTEQARRNLGYDHMAAHYNYFRDYDPATGRYTEGDPIGLDGGLNIYGYANQNPMLFIDPKGEAAAAMGVGAAGGAAGLGLGLGIYIGYLICKSLEPCPACDPPKGTKCYEGPQTSHSHGPLTTHYHIYEVQQFPSPDCTCYWRYLGGKVGRGVLGSIPPGMQPCSSFGNFKGRGQR
jgi:RHS repeat-associated protein